MGQLYSVFTRCVALCVILLSLSLTGFANQGEIKVTLEVSNKRRADVLHLLEKQTGMIFFYASNLFNTEQKISVSAVDQTLDEVLDKVFEGTGMGWNYEREKFISIKPRKKLVVEEGVPVDSNITSMPLTGKVVSSDGTPIPGATVMVKRTKEGATTDAEGNFSLPNTRKNDVVTVSSIGYQRQEISVTGRSVVLKLGVAVSDLDETVVKGYYSTTKRLNTGNVSTVRSGEIMSQPISDPVIALQGQVPGLLIQQTTGVSGSIATVRLRGRNSIANGNDPLYIVNGVPYPSTTLTSTSIGGGANISSPFNLINPADIEKIDILKDADATAIYGSRGANGVILITTKIGSIGKANLNVAVYSGVGNVATTMPLLNTTEYLMMRHEAFNNDGGLPGPNDYDINGTWDSTRYTDWQKIFIGGTSKVTDAQISYGGGTQNTQFLVNGGYRNETLVFPGDYNVRKGATSFSINHQSYDRKLNIAMLANFVFNDSNVPTSDLTSSILLAPNAPNIYDASGNLNWENSTWENPFAVLNQKSESLSKDLIGNLNIDYNIIEGLNFKTSFGYNWMTMDQSILFPSSSFDPQFSTSPTIRKNRFAKTDIQSLIVEPQLSYERRVKRVLLNTLIGGTVQENRQSNLSQTAEGFANDKLIENVAAASKITINSNNYSLYRYVAIYGRISANISDKYILNFTGRRDGSTRFGPSNRFGNFGAVGAAWIFSNEKILTKISNILSYGKVRISYGVSGNDQMPDYQYLSTYSAFRFPYQGIPGLYPTSLTNTNYSWEKIKKAEIGLEFGLLKDRILMNASYYRNRTGNQLVGYSLPATTGFNRIQYNLPAVIENSGIEMELITTNFHNQDFSWKTSINLTIPRNKLVSYPNIKGSSYANVYEIGKSLFVQKLYHFTGINPETGVLTYEDVDKDGSVSYPNDLQTQTVLSQKYYGAINNSFTYKSWKLDVFCQYVNQTGRNLLYNGLPGAFFPGNQNQPRYVLERWRKKGDNTIVQKFTQDFASDAADAFYGYSSLGDNLITDASFFRVKSISLSYQFTPNLSEKLKLKNSRLFIQCNNVFTITNYKGLDPETQGLVLPPIRLLTGGIQITL